MPSIKHILLLLILTLSTAPSNAKKKFKIIKCPQADGSVVLQDFPCMPTLPNKAKTTKPKTVNKPSTTPHKPSRKSHSNTPVLQPPPQRKPSNNRPAMPPKPQWQELSNRFNPNNLQQKKVFQNNTANIIIATVAPAQEISLKYYPDSSKVFGKKAFSAAISIFRQVTNDQTQQVTESEFVPHSSYKVFNLYHQKQKQRYFKQFYIDEANDSLYVLELTAPAKNWSAAQQTIAQITAQLKL